MALISSELGRHDHLHHDKFITASTGAAIRAYLGDTMSPQPEYFAGLRSSRDVKLLRTVHRRHSDLRAQRCLRDVDPHVENHVVLAAAEKFVRRDMEENLDIAVRAAVFAG